MQPIIPTNVQMSPLFLSRGYEFGPRKCRQQECASHCGPHSSSLSWPTRCVNGTALFPGCLNSRPNLRRFPLHGGRVGIQSWHMWRWNQRFVYILLIWLVVQISACNAGSSPVATLIPTAAWPAPQVNPGQRPDNDTEQIPPTWTHTPPPRFTLTPALSPPTPTPYQRTATPTAPTRPPTSTATPSDTPVPSMTSTPTSTPTPWPTIAMDEVWSLDRYPRPFSDNGWGMHWFSTYEQDVQTIDRFVVELQRMHIRWLVSRPSIVSWWSCNGCISAGWLF